MDEIRATKLLIGNKLLELVDEEGRELIDGLSSRVSNLLDEYGVNMGTVRTVATLFESSTPSFGNVSTDSGYIDLEDALADYDEIEIKYNAFGKTGIVKAHPADFAGSTIGTNAFHWSEIQTNNQISTDPERTVFRHMDFYATDISADNTNRLDVGAVVWSWNGDPSSAGKLNSTFTKSWNSEAGQWTSAGFVGGILAITGIKYTESGSTKDPELVDIRTGADGTVYDTAGDAVRGQVTALEGQIGTAGTNIAAAYDATQTYAVGDYCVKDNVLYKCTTAISTAEAWTAGHWTAVKVMPEMNAAVAGVNGEVQSLKEDLSDNYLNRFNFIAFEQGSLNTGSGNPLDSNVLIRTVTKIEHSMHVDTGSDAYVIANIYTYNIADDGFVSFSAVGTRIVDINPASGTYVKFTVRRRDSTAIVPSDIQPELFATKMTASAQDTDSNSLALKVTESYTDLFVKGAYISNAVSVCKTVNLSPTVNASYAYIIIPCRIGDIFTLTGTGGGTQRLYCFVTENSKQAKVAGQNTSASNENFVAPVNGFFVANVQQASAYSLTVTHRGNMADVNGIIRFVGETTIDYSSTYIKGKTIVDNGAVGDTVNITPTTNDAYGYVIVKCVKGDKFVLTGKGGYTALIWCFVDRDYKILSRSTVITVSDLELIAQQDGYFISNVQQASVFSLVKTGCADPTVMQSIYNAIPIKFIMPTSIYGKSGVSMYAYTPEIFSNWKHLNNYQLTLSGLTNAQSIEDSVAPRMILPLATKTMKMSLQNYRNNEVVNKSVLVKTVSTLSNTSATVLVIGDSFIRYKWGDGILKYMSDFAQADGVTLNFIGTATTGYGYQAEGRGGWSALDYLTHYVPTAERDPSATDEQKKMPSPFVFSDNDTVADAYFDFEKYLTVNNLTTPDIIIISLGMNDGNTSADAINTMIEDIHEDYPNIPIIVSMIPTVPRRINTGDFYTRKTTRENQNISYLAKFDGRESEKIYISPEHLAIDGILGLTGSEQNVNPVSLETGDEVMEVVNTGIHPTAVGAWNIAKWKYETLVYVMQQLT